MKIFGIDFGLCIIGFGVIYKQGNMFFYIVFGIIKMLDGDLFLCLKVILVSVGEVVKFYVLDCVVIEKVFVNVNL